jgi:TnpA family transposase
LPDKLHELGGIEPRPGLPFLLDRHRGWIAHQLDNDARTHVGLAVVHDCPRPRDLPDRKLACIEPATAYSDLASIVGRRVKVDVIREHWSEILRLVAWLQAGVVLPSAMLKRLAAYQRQNQLDLALQERGRVERTLFMLGWLESLGLRQRCQAGLNKSEQRHALAQVICTFRQGRIADRGQAAQQFRASG